MKIAGIVTVAIFLATSSSSIYASEIRIKVNQVINNNTMLVTYLGTISYNLFNEAKCKYFNHGEIDFVLEKDSSGTVDGQTLDIFVIREQEEKETDLAYIKSLAENNTYSYTTVIGATRTVPFIKMLSSSSLSILQIEKQSLQEQNTKTLEERKKSYRIHQEIIKREEDAQQEKEFQQSLLGYFMKRKKDGS